MFLIFSYGKYEHIFKVVGFKEVRSLRLQPGNHILRTTRQLQLFCDVQDLLTTFQDPCNMMHLPNAFAN